MNTPPPTIIPARRRVRRRPRRTPPTAPPPVALTLVGVEVDFFDGADGEVRLFFNTTAENPLNDVSAALPAKWTARFDGLGYQGVTLTNVGFNRIDLHLQTTGADAGPDVINYGNAPSDVADALGRQLAAFSGM